MKYLRNAFVVGVFALTACGGGGAGNTTPAASGSSPTVSSSSPLTLVSTSFAVGLQQSANASATTRKPQYVGLGAQSVSITLNTVNGGAPPNGLTLTVTSAITPASCPCSVNGPLVPPGSDNFTFTTFDGTGGSGNVVASSTGTYAIAAGVANTGNAVTLQGVPKTLAIGAVQNGTAGTAFSAPFAFTVTAKDADGNPIGGTYANAVTLTDSDASGATTVATSGNDSPPAGEVLSAGDNATLYYTGLAIAPVTLTASAPGATNGTATFAPVLSPIVYSGPLNGATPELDLYATSGTGSTGSFTASELGLTNAPYNRSLSAGTSGCGSIATISPASGTSFTFTAVGSPSAGSCTITVTNGLGQSKAVTGTYTTSGFGVN